MKPVEWINKKNIDYKRVEGLLYDSVASNQLSNGGPAVKKLEDLIKSILKIDDNKSIILTNNGTSALHALVSGLNAHNRKKLRFATQSFTFPPSAQGPLNNSIIVDISSKTGYGPDLDSINIEDVDGLIVTNVFGYCVDISKYEKWAQKHNKILIYDNAATPYTFYKGTNVCNYGVGSVISFHHTKPLGFGEGGAIVVDNKYKDLVWSMCNFGKDFSSEEFTWSRYGSNYKMSDLAAAFIIHQLDSFKQTVAHHRKLYDHFSSNITNDRVRLIPNFSESIPFTSSLIIIAETEELATDIIQKFNSLRVCCKRYYKPLEDLPVATDLYNRIVCFPCHLDMDVEVVDIIVKRINSIV